MAVTITNGFIEQLGQATMDLDSNTFKMMLLDNTYTPDKDHRFVSSINSKELSGTGYVAGFGNSGRKTLTTKTWTRDDTNDRCTWDCDDVTWSSINAGTARYAAIIKEVTSDADSYVIGIWDFGSNKVTNGGDLNVQINANGLIRMQQP